MNIGALLLIQFRDLLLKPGAHRQHAAALGVRERLDLLIVGVVLRPGGEAVLVEIRGIDDGLVGQKVGRGDDLALLLVGTQSCGRNVRRPSTRSDGRGPRLPF